MDLYDFVNHAALGSPNYNQVYQQSGSSAWGWTDPISGREFIGKLKCRRSWVLLIVAAAGLFDGASMIEILKTGKMKYLGIL